MRKRFRTSAVPFWRLLLKKGFVTIDNRTVIVLALSLLLVPYAWVLGWVLSVVVHELSHLTALYSVGVPVTGVRFGVGGAIIDSVTLTDKEELFCAAAGPIGGLILVAFTFKIPVVFWCALAQSVFNLLPIYPMDGGRIFRIISIRLFGDRTGEQLCKLMNLLVPLSAFVMILLFYMWKYV